MENAIAKCYFKGATDNQWVTYFTPHWLHIKLGKKSWRFNSDNVTEIGFGHHRLLIPLVIGGIASSFSFLMIIRNLFDPIISLVLLMAGLISIYYGWIGSSVLIVGEGKTQTKIYIPTLNQNLREYFSFYKTYRSKTQEMIIYHIATNEDWKRNPDKYHHESLQTEGFIHASKKDQLIGSFDLYFPIAGDFVLLEIDSLKLTSELKYEFAGSRNESFPHIFGPINRSSVINVLPFKNKQELTQLLKI